MSNFGFTAGKNTKYIPAGVTSYNITCQDDYIMVNTASNAVTLYLPNIKGSGLDFDPKKFYINDLSGNAGTNNITVYAIGGDVVNSGASVVLNTNGVSAEIVIVSTTEYLINRDSAYAGAVWGSITGNILNQTDLQAEFATKQDVLLYYKESTNAPVTPPVNLGTYSVLIGDENSNDVTSVGNYIFGSSNAIVGSTYVTINSLNNDVTNGLELGIYTISSIYTDVSYSAFVGRSMSYTGPLSSAFGFGESLTNSGISSNILIGSGLTATYANAVEIGPNNTHKFVVRTSGSVLLGSNNDIVFAISGGYSVAGTAGAGYGEFVGQSSAPSAGSANTFRMYAGATGALSWKRSNGADTFTRTLDGTLSANRTYTLPDASGTIALTSSLTGFFANGGNAFGATATLGTTDNFALNILTNNVAIGGFSATGDFAIGTTTAAARLYTKGSTSDNLAYAFRAVDSSVVNLFQIRNDGATELNAGNGTNSTLAVHQRPGASNTIVMDVYNASYSKLLFRTTDNGSAGVAYLAAGALEADAYTQNVGIGIGPNTARLRILQSSTNDIISINPSGGTGGIYANSSSNHPYFYMQNASSSTTVELRADGVSYFNGGALNIGATSGSGYLGIVAQSSAPSAPSAAGLRHYAGSTGAFSWVRNNGVSDTFTRTLDGTLTANRTYTLPDASGTIPLGTGSANQIVYWSSASAQTGNANFLFDSTNTGLIVGTTALTSSGDVAHFYKNQNGATYVRVQNNTSGTIAQAGILVSANSGSSSGAFVSFSAGYTTTGLSTANAVCLTSNMAAGLVIGTNTSASLSLGSNSIVRMIIDSGGLYTLTNNVASTHNHTMINTSASAGAYCQYTVSNNTSVINLGMVGTGTATSGVYLQGEAYNMTTSTGWSFGTLNASGVIRFYTGNGTLSMSMAAAGASISMPTIGTNGISYQGLVGTTTTSAIYMNQTTPSSTNFSLSSTASGSTVVNGSGNVIIQFNGSNRMICNSGGFNMTGGQGVAGISIFQLAASNNSSQTAGANVPKYIFTIGTTQWLTGALAQADFVQWSQPSVLFAGASTATLAATMTINGAPIASTNATITTSVGFLISQGTTLSAGVTTGYGAYFNPPTGAGTNHALGLAGSLNIIDANNIVVGTSTGTKFGTSVSQKIGFWNATPVVQPSGAEQAALAAYATGAFGLDSNANMQALYDLVMAMRTALVNTGLMKGAA